MEHNKKDYLFRVGPVTFFPKDTQPKLPAYLDSFEFYRNLGRIMVLGFYTWITVYVFRDIAGAKEFLSRMGSWPTSYYVIFFIPLAVSLIDLYLSWIERKTKIPMKSYSRKLIRISWLVSLVFYLVHIWVWLR